VFEAALTGTAQNLYTFVTVALLCSVTEVVACGERQTWVSRVRGFLFSAAFIAAGTAYTTVVFEGLRHVGVQPLFSLNLAWTQQSPSLMVLALGYTVVPFVSFLLFDLCFYFFHRLQHRVPMLWRLHSIHHSIEELNAFNNYHHVVEKMLQTTFILVPVALLVGIDIPQTVITVAIMSLHIDLIHANTRIGWGPFRFVFAEPRYHRVHHSIERRHWDKNFAGAFPVWDLLFGTAHFPRPNEFPRTGLTYLREPRTVRDFLFPKAPPRYGERVAQRENAQPSACRLGCAKN
jgi:sterol desaturase/sphingolipid hydroxylase (fatty acid hydroxylase superfamily)